jgi:hypothetical protein
MLEAYLGTGDYILPSGAVSTQVAFFASSRHLHQQWNELMEDRETIEEDSSYVSKISLCTLG